LRLPRVVSRAAFGFLIGFALAAATHATDIGAFYFPGWQSHSSYWRDLQGLPGSRSPGVPWPDREPLLGYYAEESVKVAETHIDWASQYGLTFFAYDWYLDGRATYLNHAIDNFIKAKNNKKLKFSFLWANHSDVPRSLKDFDDMVNYWLKHYLSHSQFYRVGGKPIVFVFSSGQLELSAVKFAQSSNSLLKRADNLAKSVGLPGIFFVATVNARPSGAVEQGLSAQGYSAYTGWNYVASHDKSTEADYQSMVDTYSIFYEAAKNTKELLPYIVPASPGWDARPWASDKAIVRTDPTPKKFGYMLRDAKQLLDSGSPGVLDILMIEAWNEFAEGSYIEPTKKWGFEYLQVIQSIFKTESTR
jgi:Glycosyltransferase WbsX